jgi:hypothetical protein
VRCGVRISLDPATVQVRRSAHGSVKRGRQDMVSGTQRCTKFRAMVQGGVDRAGEPPFATRSGEDVPRLGHSESIFFLPTLAFSYTHV